jgi:hypothetical protein
MDNTFAPILSPTYSVTCPSKQVMAEVVAALAFNGGVLFAVMPTGDGYKIIVCDKQSTTLDAAFTAARNLLTPCFPVVAENAHLEQAYEDRVSGPDTDLR